MFQDVEFTARLDMVLGSAQSALNGSERFMRFSQKVTVTTIKQMHFTSTVTTQAT